MAVIIVAGDPGATLKTGPRSCIEDAYGLIIAFGRGTTDSDITYVVRANADGTLMYDYPNAAANGLTFDTSTP